ncbi:MAG: sugar ABC transporter permease [Thermotogae bacterium]|nr:sugar ABC transporter permease [Thermotogota bacterium]
MINRKRVKEGIIGYAFISPIVIALAIFLVWPVCESFYYSFTDYNPLRQQEYKGTFNIQEMLQEYLMVFDLKNLNREKLIKQFDLVDFLQTQLGLHLTQKQKDAVHRYFDSKKLIGDFASLKLDHIVSVSRFMKDYMAKDSNMFQHYKPPWLGWKNFENMIHDLYFWVSLKNSIMFSLIVTPIQTFLALLLALAANQKIRGVKFFKTSFFIPSITSSAAISVIFMMLYSKPGVINRLLSYFGMPPVDWLNNVSTALPAIMLMNIWTTAGYFMVVFLAGLQGIPTSLIEAAELDGAQGWTRLWKIIMPLLKPQIAYVVTLGLIGTLQVFDQIYFLIKTQENYTTSMFIYTNAFSYGRMGYASAVAVAFFGIILLFTVIQRHLVSEETYF